jgi:hypothetical protein
MLFTFEEFMWHMNKRGRVLSNGNLETCFYSELSLIHGPIKDLELKQAMQEAEEITFKAEGEINNFCKVLESMGHCHSYKQADILLEIYSKANEKNRNHLNVITVSFNEQKSRSSSMICDTIPKVAEAALFTLKNNYSKLMEWMKMNEGQIEYKTKLCGEEPEFFMEIERNSLESALLSIAHRKLSNRGSGLKRDTGNPNGARIIQGINLGGVYDDEKADARIYHDSYVEHAKGLGLIDKQGKFSKKFCIIGNGNLGNNPWNVAWQHDKASRLYCLADEPLDSRTYSCFTVYKDRNFKIQDLNFTQDKVCFHNEDISDLVAWANYGQQIVRNGRPVPIEDIVEQFYDIRHIFDWKDYGPEKDENMRKLNEFYSDPAPFKNKALDKLNKRTPRAKYYHSILGIKGSDLIVAHAFGTIEEIANSLVHQAVRDAIILDNGGSVGMYASWLYPNGGFLNTQSHFRDDRISAIGLVLRESPS